MKKSISLVLLSAALVTSCVSKKKYLALESNLNATKSELSDTKSTLQKTTVAKEQLESKYAKIEARVANYNAKINSLTDNKMINVDDVAVMTQGTKDKMSAVLANVDPAQLAGAQTLKDSMNLAASHNLKKSISNLDENADDVTVDIDDTVVMISVSDKLLFNSGSYRVSSKANNLLQKLADVINSEPSMEVMIEGHTDARTINTAVLQDNWDLSVKRATSITRMLQNKYNVAPEKLIASGRSSYQPLTENDTKEGRAQNRRTRIVLVPNLDQFYSLITSN